VNDVANHSCGSHENGRPCFNLSLNRTGRLHNVSKNRPLDHGSAADPHHLAADIAFDLAFDLDISCAFEPTDHRQGCADYRGAGMEARRYRGMLCLGARSSGWRRYLYWNGGRRRYLRWSGDWGIDLAGAGQNIHVLRLR